MVLKQGHKMKWQQTQQYGMKLQLHKINGKIQAETWVLQSLKYRVWNSCWRHTTPHPSSKGPCYDMILLCLKHSVLAQVTSWSSLTRNPCTAITILKVTLFLCFFEDAPSVGVYPTSSVVVEGKNVTLSCNASGKPYPRLTWTKVGGLGQVLSQTSTLIVNNVSRTVTANNMIQYQCTADNGVGRPATAVANVTVHCKYLIVSDRNVLPWQFLF